MTEIFNIYRFSSLLNVMLTTHVTHRDDLLKLTRLIIAMCGNCTTFNKDENLHVLKISVYINFVAL